MGYALIILGIVAVITIIYTRINTYNTLVKLRNNVKNSGSHIEAQLQRRFDLIPNLVEIVKGYAEHERQIIERVIQARTDYLNANSTQEKLEMDTKLTSNLSALYVISENYPQLKANVNFLQMQKALTEIEEDISYARQFYNDAVTIYNNKLMTFPSNTIAVKYGFKEETLFKAVANAENAPRINLEIKQKSKYAQCPVCGASVSSDDVKCSYCGSSLVI